MYPPIHYNNNNYYGNVLGHLRLWVTHNLITIAYIQSERLLVPYKVIRTETG